VNNLKYTDDNGLLYLIGKIKTLVGTKVDKVEGKGLSTNDFTTQEKTKLATLQNYDDTNISNRVTTLENAGYQTQSQVQTLINSSLSSVMTYKGTVANYSDLPSQDVAVGDTYNITNASSNNNAGDNATWNGTTWDILGSNIDLSSYLQRSELVAITNNEIDTMWSSV
jgi:hypothetical protein